MDRSYDILVVGAGMAGLSAAVLLAKKGLKVGVLEQNWLPGGCSSSYPRHGFVFEAGATTLVGLDEGMPLANLLKETGISIEAWRLELPMMVHLPDGQVLRRFEGLEAWIQEAEAVFGKEGQAAFWRHCYAKAKEVWAQSGKQLHFPPSSASDFWHLAKGFRPKQLSMLPLAFQSTAQLMAKFGLAEDSLFKAFVEEQLLITAQNSAEEVNALFGTTALCYTNFGNYYVPGGMLQLVQPMVDFLEKNGGEVLLRHSVTEIQNLDGGYTVKTKKHGDFRSKYLISAIPLNNTLPLFGEECSKKWAPAKLESPQLRSAFSMGIAFKRSREFEALHHQLILEEPLPEINAKSIFVSLSHPEDRLRCKPDECVAAISTHIFDPANLGPIDKSAIEARIVEILEQKGFLRKEDILYQHSSTQKAWEKWTGRAFGFVGGYPQYMHIKPWQMKDARLDGKGAYICGDSTYPGQGIPGACLSGMAAVAKLVSDKGL